MFYNKRNGKKRYKFEYINIYNNILYNNKLFLK